MCLAGLQYLLPWRCSYFMYKYFLEWVLLTPPLYDCTVTSLVPVMLQRLEMLVYFPSTVENKPHRSNNYKYTTLKKKYC